MGMNNMHKIPLLIYFSKKIHKDLEEQKKLEGISKSAIVRRCVMNFFRKSKNEK